MAGMPPPLRTDDDAQQSIDAARFVIESFYAEFVPDGDAGLLVSLVETGMSTADAVVAQLCAEHDGAREEDWRGAAPPGPARRLVRAFYARHLPHAPQEEADRAAAGAAAGGTDATMRALCARCPAAAERDWVGAYPAAARPAAVAAKAGDAADDAADAAELRALLRGAREEVRRLRAQVDEARRREVQCQCREAELRRRAGAPLRVAAPPPAPADATGGRATPRSSKKPGRLTDSSRNTRAPPARARLTDSSRNTAAAPAAASGPRQRTDPPGGAADSMHAAGPAGTRRRNSSGGAGLPPAPSPASSRRSSHTGDGGGSSAMASCAGLTEGRSLAASPAGSPRGAAGGRASPWGRVLRALAGGATPPVPGPYDGSGDDGMAQSLQLCPPGMMCMRPTQDHDVGSACVADVEFVEARRHVPIRFTYAEPLAGGGPVGIQYFVDGGNARGPMHKLRWDGRQYFEFPEAPGGRKGVKVPWDRIVDVLSGLQCLCRRSDVDHNIPSAVRLPVIAPGDDEPWDVEEPARVELEWQRCDDNRLRHLQTLRAKGEWEVGSELDHEMGSLERVSDRFLEEGMAKLGDKALLELEMQAELARHTTLGASVLKRIGTLGASLLGRSVVTEGVSSRQSGSGWLGPGGSPAPGGTPRTSPRLGGSTYVGPGFSGDSGPTSGLNPGRFMSGSYGQRVTTEYSQGGTHYVDAGASYTTAPTEGSVAAVSLHPELGVLALRRAGAAPPLPCAGGDAAAEAAAEAVAAAGSDDENEQSHIREGHLFSGIGGAGARGGAGGDEGSGISGWSGHEEQALMPGAGKPRLLSDFSVGMCVLHEFRGEGTVQAVELEGVRVAFADGEAHTYRAESLIEGKLQPLHR